MILLKKCVLLTVVTFVVVFWYCAMAIVFRVPQLGILAAVSLLIWLVTNHTLQLSILATARMRGFGAAQRMQWVDPQIPDDYDKYEADAWKTGFAEGMLTPVPVIDANPALRNIYRFNIGKSALRIKPGESFSARVNFPQQQAP